MHGSAEARAIERKTPPVGQKPPQIDVVDEDLATAQFGCPALERGDGLGPIGALIAAARQIGFAQPEEALVEKRARIIGLIGGVDFPATDQPDGEPILPLGS